jgi:hypothetical protein
MLAGLFEANRGEGEGVSGGTAVAADLGDELTMPILYTYTYTVCVLLSLCFSTCHNYV